MPRCHYVCIDDLRKAYDSSFMATKTQHLQIRVTAHQKARLKSLARAADQGMSQYVLGRILGDDGQRFQELVAEVAEPSTRRYALAALNDFLSDLAPMEFRGAVEAVDMEDLTQLDQNYVAAMVELAASRKRAHPPDWVREVEPMAEPFFAVPLSSLRLHLLRSALVPFKRRNLFVDAVVGDRV